MKDNLVQRLDILEGQLAKLEGKHENSRLHRTKHLIERLEKSGSTPSKREILREIEEIKQEITNRKKYYAETSLRKVLKQFVKIEPLKISKRQKSQADNAEKLANLEAELQLVKSLDVNQWSVEIVQRFLAKKFGLEAEKRSLAVAEINILGRIGKMDAVKKVLTQLEESLSPHLHAIDASQPKVEKTEKQDKNGEKRINKKEDSVKDKVEKRKEIDDFTKFPEEESKDSEELRGSDEDSGDESESVDPFFEERIGLPELHEGFISGSEDDSDDDALAPEKPVRRNRRGQRARQKIWEQKYGSRANHILKREKEEEKQQQEKEQRKRKREEKLQQAKRQKIEFEKKPMHPSWVAQQKLRQQQLSVKPQGKKIQFD